MTLNAVTIDMLFNSHPSILINLTTPFICTTHTELRPIFVIIIKLQIMEKQTIDGFVLQLVLNKYITHNYCY